MRFAGFVSWLGEETPPTSAIGPKRWKLNEKSPRIGVKVLYNGFPHQPASCLGLFQPCTTLRLSRHFEDRLFLEFRRQLAAIHMPDCISGSKSRVCIGRIFEPLNIVGFACGNESV